MSRYRKTSSPRPFVGLVGTCFQEPRKNNLLPSPYTPRPSGMHQVNRRNLIFFHEGKSSYLPRGVVLP